MSSGPLASAKFRWFYAARAISFMGSSIAPVALVFAVLQGSQQRQDVAWVLVARSSAMLVFTLFGGVIGDRYPKDKLLILEHLGAAMTQGIAATILLTGHFNLIALIALEWASGAMSALVIPSLSGFVPQLVEPAQRQKANVLLGGIGPATMILGPGLAGLIAGTVGGGWALALDAATFLIAALCLAQLKLPFFSAEGRPSIVWQLREGWGEFRSRTWVWVVTSGFFVATFVQGSALAVLGPIIAEQSFGAKGWGLLISTQAVGMVVGGGLMYRIRPRRLLRTGLSWLVLGALFPLGLGLCAPFPLLVAAALVSGFGNAVFGVSWDTSLQEHVPVDKLARVSAFTGLGSLLASPVGTLCAVPVADMLGLRHTQLVSAGVWVALALIALCVPSVRGLERAAR